MLYSLQLLFITIQVAVCIYIALYTRGRKTLKILKLAMQIENTDIDKIKLHWNTAHEPFILILPPHTLQFFGIRKGNNMYFTLWPPCPYTNATLIWVWCFYHLRLHTINRLYWRYDCLIYFILPILASVLVVQLDIAKKPACSSNDA